jgi:PAS domain S-box-containing protein
MKQNEIIDLLEMSHEAFVLLNKNAGLTYASKKACQLFPQLNTPEPDDEVSLFAKESVSAIKNLMKEKETNLNQSGLKCIINHENEVYAETYAINLDGEICALAYFREKPLATLTHDSFYMYSDEIWIFFDAAGIILDFNKSAYRLVKLLTGKTLEKGMSYESIVLPEHPDPITPHMEKALQGKEVLLERHYKIRSFGFVFELHLKPVHKASRLEGVVVTTRNITAQKRLERKHAIATEELQKSESRYKGLIENAFDAIYVLNGRKFAYVNRRFTEMTGYSFEEVSAEGFDFSVTLTERSRKIVEDRYQARQRGDKLPSKYVFEVLTKTGEIIDVEITTVSLAIGSEVQVMGIMRDISAQLAAQRALEDEKAYFRHLIESLPFGIALLDEEDKIKGTNSGFRHLFGFEEHELFEKRINELIVPDLLKNEGEEATNKVAIGKEIHFETKRLRKDGSLLDVSVIGKPLQLPSGEKLVFGIYQDITENLLIKKAIEAEKAYFQGLFEIIPFGIVLLYANGEVVDCNIGFEALFGYSKKEMLGRDRINLIYPEGYTSEGELYRRKVENGESVYFETVRKRKDGTILQVAVTARPLKRPDGEVFVFAIYQDISDRKKAEMAVLDSENQLRNLIGNLPGMVYRCRLDKNYTMSFVSEGCLKIFGYSPKQFTNEDNPVSFNELILEPYREPIWRRWQEVIASDKLFEEEYEITDAGGMVKWVWERGRGVYDEQGRLQFLEGYIEDVTEQKNAEQALEKERELMQALMDNIPDTIYFKDRQSKFLRVNFAQAHVLGLRNPDEAIGLSDSDFFDELHAAKSLPQEQELLETGVSLVNQQEHILTANGWRWFTATKVPMFDKKGNIFGLVGVSRDITEIKNMETLLRESEQKLRQSNAEKDKLFSVIAHDLRGPFNSFLMLTEIFNDDTLEISIDEIKRLLSAMHKSASALVDLLENLLNWSRMQRGLASVDKREIRLRELLQNSINYFDTHLANKKQIVELEVNEELLVFADYSMLSSVFRNLISNAVKFTPEGGQILLSAERNGENNLIIKVKDSGIGIPETMRKTMFTMENKGRPGTANEPSSGLGLILVKEFVEINGGSIWFESEEKKGTVFYLKFPAATSDNIQ